MRGRAALFQWHTLQELGVHHLNYQGLTVPGMECEIELASGAAVRVWRADDHLQYFCHGLTFGGRWSPVGAISPYTGHPVEAVLRDFYQPVPEAQAEAGDVLVWQGAAPESTPHSALLEVATLIVGKRYLDDAAQVRTKNGLSGEASLPLGRLIAIYGESYHVYRRQP